MMSSLLNWLRPRRGTVVNRAACHRKTTCKLFLETLEDRCMPSTVIDPLPTDWVRMDGGTKNTYTGLVWVDESSETGSFFSWTYAQGYVANSTRNGHDDWRMPTKTEALAAADNGISQAGLLYSPNEVPGYVYWTSTTTGPRAWTVHLTDPNDSGELKTTNNNYFALPMVRDSAAIVDDGDAGYTDTGWTSKKDSSAYAGDYRTSAAGNGSKTADWTFSGLQAGADYKVVVSWKASSGNASNAPFTVFDGATAIETVAVNERVGAADFSIADLGWTGLGAFEVSSGTLKVQLSNLANGTVVADAVRVYQIGVAPTIGAVTADPNPVTAGASVALTASDVVAVNSGGTIIQVAFYLDNGGHNGLDSADTLLGYGTQNPDGTWTLTFSTTGWRPGTYRLRAQALDSYGVLSDPLELDLQVSA